MNRSSIHRLATTALATGFASLALAAPASALEAPDPEIGNAVSGTSTATTSSEDSNGNWMEISLGALGGLAIAGAGIAAVTGVRHRNAVPAG
jgi:hypothetical protein